jgi:hypothetical protein
MSLPKTRASAYISAPTVTIPTPMTETKAAAGDAQADTVAIVAGEAIHADPEATAEAEAIHADPAATAVAEATLAAPTSATSHTKVRGNPQTVDDQTIAVLALQTPSDLPTLNTRTTEGERASAKNANLQNSASKIAWHTTKTSTARMPRQRQQKAAAKPAVPEKAESATGNAIPEQETAVATADTRPRADDRTKNPPQQAGHTPAADHNREAENIRRLRVWVVTREGPPRLAPRKSLQLPQHLRSRAALPAS